MKPVDVIKEALVLVFFPEGESWRDEPDSKVEEMWERHKVPLAGPVQDVIERKYFSQPEHPPEDIWTLYLEANDILAEIERRAAEREDEMIRRAREGTWSVPIETD